MGDTHALNDLPLSRETQAATNLEKQRLTAAHYIKITVTVSVTLLLMILPALETTLNKLARCKWPSGLRRHALPEGGESAITISCM